MAAPPSAPPIWLAGPVLTAVHTANLYADCKDFVDAPLQVPPEEAWRRWNDLAEPIEREALQRFVNATFGAAGGELVPFRPPDYQPSPPLLSKLPAGAVREWASQLNGLWEKLGRSIAPSVVAAPDRSTLLPAARGFVVPGGRFREVYYWDTYWVVLGLLAVGMHSTATSVTANLLDTIRTHGFVPNGLRAYYLNRSQPPLLTQMVAALHDAPFAATAARAPSAHTACDDDDTPASRQRLLADALPLLDREYMWWMRGGANGSLVTLAPRGGAPAAKLNRYIVATDAPRPESWREDMATAAELPVGSAQRAQLFGDLAAAAESGWDFSTRWLAEPPPAPSAPSAPPSLSSIRTSRVLPVDLNSFLYRNEMALHRLHASAAAHAPAADSAAHTAASAAYAAAAAERSKAMRAWMWDDTSHRWHDLLVEEASEGARVTARVLEQESAASYAPLWAGLASGAEAAAAVAALGASDLVQAGGVATTLSPSGQQWDWPNAWPPLQQVTALSNLPTSAHTCPHLPYLATSPAFRDRVSHACMASPRADPHRGAGHMRRPRRGRARGRARAALAALEPQGVERDGPHARKVRRDAPRRARRGRGVQAADWIRMDERRRVVAAGTVRGHARRGGARAG